MEVKQGKRTWDLGWETSKRACRKGRWRMQIIHRVINFSVRIMDTG